MIYITNSSIPSKTANTYQSFQMCYAFSKTQKVKMLFPSGKLLFNKIFFQRYGVKNTFKLSPVYSIDYKFLFYINKKIWFYIKVISFKISLVLRLFFVEKENIIYSRDATTFRLLNLLKKYSLIKSNVFLEIHDFKQFYLSLSNVNGIIVLNKILKSKFIKLKVPVIVAHDGVNLDNFQELDKLESRELLDLNRENYYCIYSGRYRTLNIEKGIPEIIKASVYLDKKIKFIFIGGPINQIDSYLSLIDEQKLSRDRFIFIDYVDLKTLNTYLSAADVFLMPFPNIKHFSENMSPLKMFEYMAMRRPIVASDLPSIREILDENNSFICMPNNPKDLSIKINSALQKGQSKIEIAFKLVQNYTWDKRSEKINRFINEITTL